MKMNKKNETYRFDTIAYTYTCITIEQFDNCFKQM